MQIRKACEADIKELTAIYNYEITHGTATFDCEEKTIEDRLCWLHAHNQGNHPLLVCEENGQVCGYASLSPYGTKDAFTTTVELSVYVAVNFRGRGIAKKLIDNLLSMVRGDGKTHLVISVITSGNAASVGLHKRLGFTFRGSIPEIAKKFGKYLSVDIYTMTL
ncbi:MAG: GNAT family N-acetyltransferase [Succinatimonas hippei]|nr:GNAT family N-acetyltransferase [Succinatimonas hippei]